MNAYSASSRRVAMVAVLLAVFPTAILSAQAPPSLDLVLKPHMVEGQMDYLEVVEKLSNVDVAAGSPLLRIPMIAAGVPSARYDASSLTVSDASGPVTLTQRDDPADPANNRYLRRWTATRPVRGELAITYRGTPNPPATYRG